MNHSNDLLISILTVVVVVVIIIIVVIIWLAALRVNILEELLDGAEHDGPDEALQRHGDAEDAHERQDLVQGRDVELEEPPRDRGREEPVGRADGERDRAAGLVRQRDEKGDEKPAYEADEREK